MNRTGGCSLDRMPIPHSGPHTALNTGSIHSPTADLVEKRDASRYRCSVCVRSAGPRPKPPGYSAAHRRWSRCWTAAHAVDVKAAVEVLGAEAGDRRVGAYQAGVAQSDPNRSRAEGSWFLRELVHLLRAGEPPGDILSWRPRACAD